MFGRDSAEDNANDLHFPNPSKANGLIRTRPPGPQSRCFSFTTIKLGARTIFINADVKKRSVKDHRGVISIQANTHLESAGTRKEKPLNPRRAADEGGQDLHAKKIKQGRQRQLREMPPVCQPFRMICMNTPL